MGPGCAVTVFVGHDDGGCCDGARFAVAAAYAIGVEVHDVRHIEGRRRLILDMWTNCGGDRMI